MTFKIYKLSNNIIMPLIDTYFIVRDKENSIYFV